MNPEVKQKWIEALRSGKYKQGKTHLHPTIDTFCCLGVLCDISNLGQWKTVGTDSYYMTLDKIREISFLPDKIEEWADITVKAQYELAYLNDVCGYNFNIIADIIEESL